MESTATRHLEAAPTAATKMTKVLALALATMTLSLLAAVLIPAAPAEAAAYSGNPCPHYSIQDVFDDPNSDWDGDLINNSNELYNGLNPCIPTGDCLQGGNPLCEYERKVYVVKPYSSPCLTSVAANPTLDYDNDGVANAEEQRNGADPCRYPCPNARQADLRLNPNADWDGDGISNALEVSRGTDPCTRIVSYVSSNPCPHYTSSDVTNWGGDWDGDGFSNRYEVNNGYNPCVWNASVIVPRVTTQTQSQRLPHVTNTNTAPVRTYVPPVPPVKVCPTGYPYYHRGNGLCYANPVGHWYGY